MTEIIERDAIANTPHAPIETHEHTHEEMKTFYATPRQDSGFIDRIMKWFKGEALKPGLHIVQKDDDPMRYMFIITSNSYEDREKETITSKALQAYEDSCYPGDGVFHCDNDYVYWHDPDVVMGEIVAVNYSEPFLIEIAKEKNTPVAKVLWDYEQHYGGKAGASHQFGYFESDRLPDGTYEHIYKKETTYLPEVELAANARTYAGVMDMASARSDQRLNEIFKKVTGMEKDFASMIHAKSGEAEKILLEHEGLVHKALPPAAKQPPIPPKRAAADAQVLEADAAAQEGAMIEDEAMAEDMEEEAEVKTESTMDDLKRMSIVLSSMFDMMQTIIQDSADTELGRIGMMKAYDELKEIRMSEKAAEKATLDSLEARLKALQEDYATTKARLADAEKALAMKPRSVTHEKGGTADELKVAIDRAEKSKEEGELVVDSFWGKLKPLPKD